MSVKSEELHLSPPRQRPNHKRNGHNPTGDRPLRCGRSVLRTESGLKVSQTGPGLVRIRERSRQPPRPTSLHRTAESHRLLQKRAAVTESLW